MHSLYKRREKRSIQTTATSTIGLCEPKRFMMKSTIFLTSNLAAAVMAWPKPQLLDLNLGAKVTVFATVTVTKPATTCLPVTVTATKPATACLPVTVTIGAPTQPSIKPSTSKIAPLSQTPLKPTSVVQTSSRQIPLTTSKPVASVQTSSKQATSTTSKPVASVQSSSKITSTPSTTLAPKPTPQIPSNGGRVTGTAQAYLSVGLEYQAAILYHHNAARANHGAPPLTWDTTCESNARLAANTCNYAPYFPAGVVQGQNLYLTTGDAFNVTAAVTEVWYKNEFSSAVPWFGLASLPVTLLPGIRHLTQVLWKGNSKVGCASVDCGTKMKGGGATPALNKYTVCNYASTVDFGAQFGINVGIPLSKTNLGKWTD